ncbi:SIS domain-containing protein (plasmid) [Enterococcus faecium]|uniref:6-phospho-3-hexuloisomerase n=1 Tax=Enterococcus faecium TaxID=1352 RepID=UPI0018E8BCCE|nr:6-phospho-3-hexuloisomerase [Enterococcus faecium]MBJ2302376.1 SIS domain-containing protein [Enterococcus faecium]QQG23704.1 SIS domain-containing protein [Enterococcus faecium]QQG26476.1 SIS domain-containing protein [Enterococcus faecium]
MTNKDQNKNYLEAIILELQNNSKRINSVELEQFSEKIVQAKHIFLAGAGRSGIAMQAFTNRLMHLGFSVSLVGEISSPHSQPGDLLIICSGSGETGSLKNLAAKANQSGVSIALVTMKKDSSIGQLADSVLVLPGIAKDENQREEDTFSQPMGSSFEQLAFLTFDSLVLSLMDKTGESSETMFARHADFE